MKRRTSVLAAVAAFTVVALSIVGMSAPTDAAADSHVTQHRNAPLRGHRNGSGSGTLSWNGGPVQHGATVYLDFYGSQWNSDPNGVANYLTQFFNGLDADTWSRILSQYTDASGPASVHTPALGGVWFHNSVSSPTDATAAQLSAEANAAAAHFGVSGPNVDMYVVSPSGTHPDGFGNAGFCSWHDWNGTVPYINLPYVLDLGASCGAGAVGSQLDGFSILGTHEFVETLTDPEPGTGWIDNASGEEIGDLCAWQGLYPKTLPTGTFAVEPIWYPGGGCTRW